MIAKVIEFYVRNLSEQSRVLFEKDVDELETIDLLEKDFLERIPKGYFLKPVSVMEEIWEKVSKESFLAFQSLLSNKIVKTGRYRHFVH